MRRAGGAAGEGAAEQLRLMAEELEAAAAAATFPTSAWR